MQNNIEKTNKTTPKPAYHIELENIIKRNREAGKFPSLLLHSCCGPCSSYVLFYLMQYFDITVFFYNPNIFPQDEYEHRLSEQKRLIECINGAGKIEFQMNDSLYESRACSEIKLETVPYIHEEFSDSVKGFESEPEGGARCKKCFELRLLKTKELASAKNFDYFGTTLTVSPHKNAVLINELGEEISNITQKMTETKTAGNIRKETETEVAAETLFLPSDFKKNEGYRISIILSKQYKLYRQNYCGCEFSKNI